MHWKSADSIVVVSADILLFAIVHYTSDLLCSLRFIFFVVRISKDVITHCCFDQCENAVLAREHDFN